MGILPHLPASMNALPSSQFVITGHAPIGRRLRMAAAAVALGLIAGCAQVAVLGKIFYGDPRVTAAFEQITGESLQDRARVALVCTAPESVQSEFDTLAIDLQEELIRRMSRRGIDVLPADEVSSVLDKNAGLFDAQLLAEELELDYVLHVDVEQFSHRDAGSPNLLRGRSLGNVYGYAVRESSPGKQALQVFEREFRSEYPTSYPISVDQTPEKVFRRRFVDHLSDQVGRMFYDFRTSEAFAN